jgi:hypothetical protein
MHLVWYLARDLLHSPLQRNIAMLTTVWYKGKSKAAPVQAMKIYRGNAGIAPLILKLGTRWRWVVNFTSRPLYHLEIAPIPLNRSLGGHQLPVWKFGRRKTFLTAARIGIPDGLARGLVTTLTTLSRLPAYCHISSHLSYFIPHSATYSAPPLNDKPLNKESTKQSSTIFPVSRL